MNNLFSPSWWISTFTTVFITMIFIWIIKKAFAKVEVPVISNIVEEV